jgi:hypothetical protein
MVRRQNASLPRRIALGAAFGTTAGALFVAVGLLRAAASLLGGGRIEGPSAHDLGGIAFYIGGFGTGGALFGALRPLLPGKGGVYAGCMLVGVIVMLAIAVGDKGSLAALDAVDWVVMPAVGMLFGAGAAFGWTRSPG